MKLPFRAPALETVVIDMADSSAAMMADYQAPTTRILVVENDPFMADALVAMLNSIAEVGASEGLNLPLQVPLTTPVFPFARRSDG